MITAPSDLLMPYLLGAEVVITSLGKVGRIVEVGRNGRYRVRLGAVVMTCQETDLVAAAASGGPRRAERRHAAHSAPAAAAPSDAVRIRLGSLDLHGCTVEEAQRAVEARLDAALRAGLDHLDIIHGRGTVRVKHAVHQFLRDVGAVRHFEVTRDNPGVTRVFF
jgi:DNA mismatch repair protein MutS2